MSESEIFIKLMKEESKIFGAKFHSIRLNPDNLNNIELDFAHIRNAQIDHFEIKNVNIDFNLTFIGCRFGNYSESGTSINGDRKFRDCFFRDSVSYYPDESIGATQFSHVRFSRGAEFKGNYQGRFEIIDSTNNMAMKLKGINFYDDFVISEGDIRGEIHASNASFHKSFTIEKIDFPLRVVIDSCDISQIRCVPDGGLPSLVDIRNGTEISKGGLNIPEDGSVYYDLGHSTVGDIDLDLINGAWDNYLFKSTKFNDFNLISLEDRIRKNNYEIHNFGYSLDLYTTSRIFPDGMFSRCDVIPDSLIENDTSEHPGVFPADMMFVETESGTKNSKSTSKSDFCIENNDGKTWFPADLFLDGGETADDFLLPNKNYTELTYLGYHVETYTRAKNHAQTDGIDSLVSEFFIKQKEAERAKFRSQSKHASRIQSKFRYSIKIYKNTFLRWLYKYGERPIYPVVWSGILIGACSFLYINTEIIQLETNYDSLGLFNRLIKYPSAETFIDSLYYSTVVFTSLGSGTYTPGTRFAEIVVAVESLLGAFLIALFVFTLARQVSR